MEDDISMSAAVRATFYSEVICLKRMLAFFVSFILCLLPVRAFCQAGDGDPAEGINPFDYKLLPLMYQKFGQFAFSPMSLEIALAMAAEGAEGETYAALLAFMETGELTERDFSRYPELKIANAAIVSDSVALLDSYRWALEGKYRAEFIPMDEDVVKQVNIWAKEHTDGMIPEFLTERPNDSLRLILLNALVLDAKWSAPFNREGTWDSVFHSPEGELTVPFMHQSKGREYADADGVQAVKLGYEQSNLELTVILPEEGGMARTLDRLAHEGTGWLGEFRWVEEVRLALPKLCMQSALDLKQIMLDIGCSLPFSLAADFSGMTGDKDLIIGAIMQKVRLDIDEEGTKAAAVTAVMISDGAAPRDEPESVEVIVDRPYILLLQDRELGATLFAAVVTNPR